MKPKAVAIAALVLAALLGACSSDADPQASKTATTGEPEPSATDELVIERRPMTAAEYDRIDDDGEGGVLDCARLGAATWDYGPIGPSDPTDRTADDALLDAIAELNEEREAVPDAGWIELTERPGRSTFLSEDDEWRALIVVLGEPETGVWRHVKALFCPP